MRNLDELEDFLESKKIFVDFKETLLDTVTDCFRWIFGRCIFANLTPVSFLIILVRDYVHTYSVSLPSLFCLGLGV